jgi:hypothetical protein
MMSMTRTLLLTTLLVALSGCKEDSALNAMPDNGSEDFDMEAVDDTAPPEADGPDSEEADLASLQGVLTVLDGNIIAEQSSLEITLFNGDFELCTADVFIQAAELSVVDDPSVVASSWWTLSLAPGDTDAALNCDAPVPSTLGLGAAPYDPQLASAADSAGFEDDGSTLYSALAQLGTGEAVYLYGVLGTDAQFDGMSADDPAAQVEDGTYTLSTLYLLPLTDLQ